MDRWADWLIRGRTRGMTRARARKMTSALNRVRDRLIKEAAIKPGQVVLDAGAGTGLLALRARDRAGPEGRVVALDVSADALRECVRVAADGATACPLLPVAGDVRRLPVRDSSVHVVMTRSVLIFVQDKPAAIRELHRVLKPGGVAAVFEPINDVSRASRRSYAEQVADRVPDYERVRNHAAGPDEANSLLGFDERDVVRWFREAGFTSVKLAYEEIHHRGDAPPKPEAVAALLTMRPNPNSTSHEEAAREVLGEQAEGYLLAVAEAMTSLPSENHSGVAYVTAHRGGSSG